MAKQADTTPPLRDFIAAVRPGYQWYRHCEELAAALEAVEEGRCRRLMVFMPPRHGKSLLVSQLFAAHYLRRYPDRWVGLNSYSASLALTLSRNARDNYGRSGGALRSDSASVAQWETRDGGGMWAAGVGGPITGRGFHLGIIDDPLKNAEEANSETIREKQKDWYQSTFYTRAEPDAAILVIQTRWHEDDLSGWLLSLEGDEDEAPEGWHIVSLPALAEPPQEFPAGCTTAPDWRREGEALCPERYLRERLLKIKGKVGDYYWNALYQQRAKAREGGFFKPDRIEVLPVAPAGLRRVRGWDLAATEGGGDYTSGLLLGADGEGRFYILDVVRGQWGPDRRNAILKETVEADGKAVLQRLPQDPAQAGKEQAKNLTRLLAGYPVKFVPVSGDKELRADPFAAQVNVGNVCMVKAPWNHALREELRAFPNGARKDQVDAGADAVAELATPARRLEFY